MAISIIDINQTKEFISKADKDSKNPTIFVLKIISNKDKYSISEGFSGKDIDVQSMLKIVKSGLKEVRNVYDKSTDTYRDYTVIDDNFLDSLPMSVIGELSAEITNFNFLGEEERKNS